MRGGSWQPYETRDGFSLTLTASDRNRLEALVANGNMPQKHVWSARIVLFSAEGYGTLVNMRAAGAAKAAVWRWWERSTQKGVDALLRDKMRPSGIPPVGPEVAERIVALTQSDSPRGGKPLDSVGHGAGGGHLRLVCAAHLA